MNIENRLQLLESKAKHLQKEMIILFVCIVDCIDGKPCEIPATCWRYNGHRIFIEPSESQEDFKARAESTFKGLVCRGGNLVIYQDIVV